MPQSYHFGNAILWGRYDMPIVTIFSSDGSDKLP